MAVGVWHEQDWPDPCAIDVYDISYIPIKNTIYSL